MSSTADRADLISEVEDHLRGVAKVVRRAMLDAMPDGEPDYQKRVTMPGRAMTASQETGTPVEHEFHSE